MEKLVRESIGFERTGDVKSSLGIGHMAKVRELFRKYEIPDDDYTVYPNGKVVYHYDLNLSSASQFLDITLELPNNLTVEGNLDLSYNTIVEIPNNLIVDGFLNLNFSNVTEEILSKKIKIKRDIFLKGSNITELSDYIEIGGDIFVNYTQTELINFLEKSKFQKQVKKVKY